MAKRKVRSNLDQIKLWAKIRKGKLDNPDLPLEFIKKIIIAKNEDVSFLEPFIPQEEKRPSPIP